MQGKGVMINDRPQEYPDADYNKKYNLVESRRYGGTSLGLGNRSDFMRNSSNSPGPAYKLPSIFDKYARINLSRRTKKRKR